MTDYSTRITKAAGVFLTVPSAITAKNLTYFCPDALNELCDRSAPVIDNIQFADSQSTGSSLVFLKAASSTDNFSSTDVSQAARILNLLIFPTRFKTLAEIIQLAREILPSSQGLRDQISFSAGTSASASNFIYAPPEQVYGLLISLVRELNSKRDNSNSRHACAITGFFCTHVHPFNDGNGRWSRLISLQEGLKYGDSVSSLCNVAMQRALSHELARIVWPATRVVGLESYLRISEVFERSILAKATVQQALTFSNEVYEWARKKMSSQTELRKTILELYVQGGWTVGDLRGRCSSSIRSIAGFFELMALKNPNLCSLEHDRFSIDLMNRQMEFAIVSARTDLFTD